MEPWSAARLALARRARSAAWKNADGRFSAMPLTDLHRSPLRVVAQSVFGPLISKVGAFLSKDLAVFPDYYIDRFNAGSNRLISYTSPCQEMSLMLRATPPGQREAERCSG